MIGFIKGLLGRPKSGSAQAQAAAGPVYLQDGVYAAPTWANALALKPEGRVGLAMLPTPVHRWPIPGLPAGVELFIKRDDMSGMELSGNKVISLGPKVPAAC
jgi:hypothetical protein